MTRLELLKLVVGRARSNGFEFRRWYTTRLGLPWISAEAAIALLDTQRRYYALLFSHEFASCFWKAGSEITFEVPAQSFPSRMPDGSVRTIERKAFIRRSVRRNVWRYHLQHMALAEEPLRYLRKYLHIEDQLEAEPETEPRPRRTRLRTAAREEGRTPALRVEKGSVRKRGTPRPLSQEPPAFLK